MINTLFFQGKKVSFVLFLLSSAGGFLLVSGYWIVALWERFGNPVFPLYNRVFRSPYWTISNFTDTRWFPQSASEWIFYPFYFTHAHQIMELSVENYAFMFVYILIIVYLALKLFPIVRPIPSSLHLSENERILCLFFVISFVIWEIVFSYYRYLSPLESLAPLTILIFLRHLFKKAYLSIYVGFLVFMAFHIQYPDWGRVAWGKNFFGINTGSLGFLKKQRGTILVGAKPIAFVIPELPGKHRYVSIIEGESVPSVFWKQRLLNDPGSVYLLTSKLNFLQNRVEMKQFGINFLKPSGSCLPVINRMDPNIVLCRLMKKVPTSERGNRRVPSGAVR